MVRSGTSAVVRVRAMVRSGTRAGVRVRAMVRAGVKVRVLVWVGTRAGVLLGCPRTVHGFPVGKLMGDVDDAFLEFLHGNNSTSAHSLLLRALHAYAHMAVHVVDSMECHPKKLFLEHKIVQQHASLQAPSSAH